MKAFVDARLSQVDVDLRNLVASHPLSVELRHDGRQSRRTNFESRCCRTFLGTISYLEDIKTGCQFVLLTARSLSRSDRLYQQSVETSRTAPVSVEFHLSADFLTRCQRHRNSSGKWQLERTDWNATKRRIIFTWLYSLIWAIWFNLRITKKELDVLATRVPILPLFRDVIDLSIPFSQDGWVTLQKQPSRWNSLSALLSPFEMEASHFLL